jgi:uncharacterized protein YbaP (TraB family)
MELPLKRIASIAALVTAFATAHAEPPVWTVSDEDSSITLYPTIHFLPEDIQWRSPALKEALEAAGEVWFEIPMAQIDDQSGTQALVMELGLSPDRPLSERLDEETRAELERVAADLGIPMAQFEVMRPWLAGLTIGVADLMAAGFDPNSGVERHIDRMIEDKPRRAFESMEEQLRFFANLPEETEVAFLKSAIETAGQAPAELAGFARDWASGDVSGLDDFINDNLRDVDEELYRVLIVERNRAWAEALSEELAGEGTDFVAVGAGHLVGEDSLPQLLRNAGYKVTGPGLR